MSSPSPSSPSLSVDSFTELSDVAPASPLFAGDNDAVMVSNRGRAIDINQQGMPDHLHTHNSAVDGPQGSDALGVRSERFFFSADMLTFVVEGTVYRVHAYLFSMCSPFWAKKLVCGASAEAIHLDDVAGPEMDAFLSTQYPTTAESRDARTANEWTAILRLTTMWCFETGRKHAIAALDTKLSLPLERLVLARAHAVEAWLQPAFLALCMRPEPLKPDEARRLSLEDVLTIMTVREELLRCNRGCIPSEKVATEYLEKYIGTAPSGSPSELAGVSLALFVPPSATQLKAASKLLSGGLYKDVVGTLSADNMETFTRLLADFSPTLKTSSRFDSIVQAIFHRAATEPSFIPVGTKYLAGLPDILARLRQSSPERVSIDKGDFRTLLRSNATLLRQMWSTCADAIEKFGSLDLVLRHTLCTAHQAYVRTGFEAMVGKCEDLKRSAELYNVRCTNLHIFLASLVDAELIPRM